DAKEVQDILPKLRSSLTTIKILFLYCEEFHEQRLLEMIFCRQTMPSLKSCDITYRDGLIQNFTKSTTSNIENLNIRYISIKELILLFQYLPKLKRLYAYSATHFRHLVYSDHLRPSVLLKTLTHLKLHYVLPPYNLIEILFRRTQGSPTSPFFEYRISTPNEKLCSKFR
ncbi:unnamed protein product, partial [Didymodactylos carnosus]